MNKALVKLVEGEHIELPKTCIDSLKRNFSNAINIEWTKINADFEAIFYQDNLEYIALFKADGELIEYRRIIPEGYLPFSIRQLVMKKGEVMNRVLVNRGNELFYEVIYRDQELNRFMILISDLGKVISHSKL
jgi:hypothetical protein